MKRLASAAVHEAAALMTSETIMVLGVRTRTSFEDHDRLAAVLGELRFHVPELRVIHADALPFDALITRYCQILGIHYDRFGPDPLGPDYVKERCLPYARDPSILELASLLVVFPDEPDEPDGTETVYEADINVVMHAETLGIPVLAIWRNDEELIRQ